MTMHARAGVPGRVEVPPPFRWCDEHLGIDLPEARALFTTRRGGISEGPYLSLNLGKLTDDDPAAVERNRGLLQARVGGRLAMIRQVHGARVVRITAAEQVSGAAPQGELEQADGIATGARDAAPIVLTADCLPIALAGGGAVAMLHAGWRGLASGIIGEGVRALRELGRVEPPIAAAIGPGAGGCCYEVGEEVLGKFQAYPGACRGRNLDLKAVACQQLLAAGVETVHDTGLCTICSDPSLFFSHRRDRGVTGRQAGSVRLS